MANLLGIYGGLCLLCLALGGMMNCVEFDDGRRDKSRHYKG